MVGSRLRLLLDVEHLSQTGFEKEKKKDGDGSSCSSSTVSFCSFLSLNVLSSKSVSPSLSIV